MTEERMTVKQAIRRWIEIQVQNGDRFNKDELIEAALEHFSQDPKFMEELAAKAIPEMVGLVINSVFRNGRDWVHIGPEVVPTMTYKKEAAQKPWKFDKWTEHVGNSWHVKLMDLTGLELDVAIEERERQGIDQLRKADFLKNLRKNVGDGEHVRDKWTQEEIERAFARAFNTN